MIYKHTQLGYIIMSVLIIVVLFYGFIVSINLKEISLIMPTFLVIFLVLFILASFSTLTVVIDNGRLRIKFGYGIFKKSFILNEIISVKKVKNHWYYGWGIRLWFWPYMWIYNVSGFDAIEIKMNDNKIFRIGTDEPEKLEQAILKTISR